MLSSAVWVSDRMVSPASGIGSVLPVIGFLPLLGRVAWLDAVRAGGILPEALCQSRFRDALSGGPSNLCG